MRVFFAIITFFLFVPGVSHGSVIINEVAWMGTVKNSYDEWIELHNNGNDDISFEGWVIVDGGASPLVVLSGTLASGAYTVLKTTYGDGEQDDVSEHVISYARLLSDGGKTLILKNAEGTEIDKVIGGTNWENIGGEKNLDADSIMTAQRNGEAWVTGTPTPGKANVSLGTENGEKEETNISEVNNNTSSSQTVRTLKTNSGGGSKKELREKREPPELKLSVLAPRTVYVNQDVAFEAAPSGVGDTIERSLSYTWNFGDTYTGAGKKPVHVFEYPGEYTVVAEGVFAKQYALARHEISVLPVSFVLGMTERGDITIKNNAKYEVDLGGFTLRGSSVFTFSKYTILRAGGTLTIPKARVSGGERIALYDTQHTRVTSYGEIVESSPLIRARVASSVTTSKDVAKKIEEKTEKREEVNKEEKTTTDTVIQIGAAKKEETRGFTQFFKKFASFFGL